MGKLEELAHGIIDVVEDAICVNKPQVDLIRGKSKGNTLLYGEVYYDVENEIVRRLREAGLK